VRVLLSGSTGFIGSALRAALEARGDEVTPIVRTEPRAGQVGFDLAQRRLDTAQLADDSLSGFDAVVHLAGEPLTPTRWGPAKREAIRSSRIATTDVVARALAACEEKPAVFLTQSASGYYGSRGDEELDEGSGSGVGFLPEVCRAWEAAAGPAAAAGVRVVHARTGIVIGRGGGMLASLEPLFRIGLGARLAGGRQWMSTISLQDEVAALLHLIDLSDASGAYNLCAPMAVTNGVFTAALASALHRPARLAVPRAALLAACGRRTTDEFILASQHMVPRRLLESGFSFSHLGIDDILTAGMRPPSSR
jgi:uncharacterized protein (TIGR01777 family)